MKYLEKILTKEKLEEAYVRLGGLKPVGREFGVDAGTIKRYMEAFGLDYQKQVRYNCNHDFFSEDNEKAFYWAGFLAADGCVLDKHGTTPILSISLSENDTSHLEKFKQDIKAENSIKHYLVKNGINKSTGEKYNDSWKCEIKITSQKISDDLKKFNIVPRKTKIYTMPEWLKTHPFRQHFLRGYNDGDGSFYWQQPKNRASPHLMFSLRGTPEFLIKVREMLEEDLNLEKRMKPIRISSGHGILEYGGNGVLLKIVSYLYNDANVFLDRKKEIAFEIFEKKDLISAN